jgi:hypothetical protein
VPFVKTKKKNQYRGPSGRTFNRRQVKRYYARGGRFDAHDGECKCRVCDTASRRDPTGTFKIQRSFVSEINRRVRALRRLTSEALGDKDLFGLSSSSAATITLTMHLTPTPVGNDRARAFTEWMTQAVGQTLGSNDARWVAPYITTAYMRGIARAQTYAHEGEVSVPSDGASTLVAATAAEVSGAADAVVQTTTRLFAAGILAHWTRVQIMRAVVDRIEKIGGTRSRASASFAVVNAFNSALLSGLKSLGVTKVGIKAETVKKKLSIDSMFTVDAPSAAFIKKATRTKRRLEQLGEVNVVTAGDDDVCPRCEQISEDGPYDIDRAQGLIPAHAHCRCAFEPADDEE